ncbi:unnamed protein product, partial [Owenia fusiformis]
STLTTSLTWMRPNNDEIKCDEIQVYNIYRNGEKLSETAGNNIELPIDKFAFDTQYKVELTMINNANLEGIRILVFDTLTPADKPSPPRELSLSGSDVNSFNLTWSPPEFTNGRLRQYQVSCYENTTFVVFNQTLPSVTREVFVSGLEEYTKYDCEIRASTRAGFGPANGAKFETAKGTPLGAGGPGTTDPVPIIGAVIGVILVAVLATVIVVFIRKRRLKKDDRQRAYVDESATGGNGYVN